MLLKYKNFIAEINYIGRTGCFCGEVINNKNCLIVFQAQHQQKLAEAFKIAVEQYLEPEQKESVLLNERLSERSEFSE